MSEWKVFCCDEISEEQQQWLNQPRFADRKSVVLVSMEVSELFTETIIIGENNIRNQEQARVVCQALNDARIAGNPHCVPAGVYS